VKTLKFAQHGFTDREAVARYHQMLDGKVSRLH